MRKPAGWKRLSEQEAKKLKECVSHFDHIRAWKKGDVIVGVGRYYYPGGCRGGWGYNIFSFKTSEKTKWGDEVYEQITAINLAYYEMRRRDGKSYRYEPKPKYVVYCAKCDYEKTYEKIPRSRKWFGLSPVTNPEKFRCPMCKINTLKVRRGGEPKETEPALGLLRNLFG